VAQRPGAQKGRSFPFARSAKSLQENVTRSAPVAVAAYSLVGGIILFGAIGYGLDRWLGTDPWLLMGGLVAGMVVGFYELAKIAWPK
jgi:F0F1-type ATP synthase assembly protein I